MAFVGIILNKQTNKQKNLKSWYSLNNWGTDDRNCELTRRKLEAALVCQSSIIYPNKCLLKGIIWDVNQGTRSVEELKKGWNLSLLLGDVHERCAAYLSWVAVPHVFHHVCPSTRPCLAVLFQLNDFYQIRTTTGRQRKHTDLWQKQNSFLFGKSVPQTWCQCELS